jgi:SpoVK/Ycf46/Vps4 family AAA+-type ATPase
LLHPSTLCQIRKIEYWITHHDTLLHAWGRHKKINPCYRALFYDPWGTGKTLTATLLDNQTGKDVFRIDLSRVFSIYIGETETNLSRLVDMTENRGTVIKTK